MKILQVTAYGTLTNYGAVLQAFGLQKALESLGHDVVQLRLDFDLHKALRKWYRSPSRILKVYRRIRQGKREERLHPRHFERFRSEHMKCTEKTYVSHSQLLRENWDVDAMVVGSDWVWVWDNKRHPLPAYFLKFGPDHALRFSYAAGIGNRARMDEGCLRELKEQLAGFKSISLREDEGVVQCRSAGLGGAVLMPDPTFLLSVVDYARMLKLPEPSAERYVLVYVVGKDPSRFGADLEAFSRRHHCRLKIVRSQFMDRHVQLEGEVVYPTIEEWLGYIRDAEYVVTDSFHGSAFSLQFNRRLAIIPPSSHDARFDTLKRLFDLQPVFYQGDMERTMSCPLDHGIIDERLAELRRQGFDFLEKTLRTP